MHKIRQNACFRARHAEADKLWGKRKKLYSNSHIVTSLILRILLYLLRFSNFCCSIAVSAKREVKYCLADKIYNKKAGENHQ